MNSVLLKTVGCRLNQAESTELSDAFRARGARVVEDSADIVVVNTCTVTSESSRTSRKLIRKAISENPGAEVIVTGCYAVAAPSEVAGIAGVSRVIPNKDKDQIATRVIGRVAPAPGDEEPPVAPRRTLKVQTGCDEVCTYCIVPETRGSPDSRPVADITAAALRLADAGVREITLSGVHLGRFQSGSTTGLVPLVRELLDALPMTVAIRLSSIELTCVTDELIELVAGEPRVCRHLHIPLQSGDDEILSAMGRPYSAREFLEVTGRASRMIDAVALTTDVMVGFPGESDEAFSRTIQVVEAAGFMKLHVFRYSPRPGTPAASLPGQVASEVQKARSHELRRLGEGMRLGFHERNGVSRGRVTALVEAAGGGTDADPGRPTLHCVTDNYMKAQTSGPSGLVGCYVELEVTGATSELLMAAPLDDQALRGSGLPG